MLLYKELDANNLIEHDTETEDFRIVPRSSVPELRKVDEQELSKSLLPHELRLVYNRPSPYSREARTAQKAKPAPRAQQKQTKPSLQEASRNRSDRVKFKWDQCPHAILRDDDADAEDPVYLYKLLDKDWLVRFDRAKQEYRVIPRGDVGHLCRIDDRQAPRLLSPLPLRASLTVQVKTGATVSPRFAEEQLAKDAATLKRIIRL